MQNEKFVRIPLKTLTGYQKMQERYTELLRWHIEHSDEVVEINNQGVRTWRHRLGIFFINLKWRFGKLARLVGVVQ